MIDLDHCRSHPYRCDTCGTRFTLPNSLHAGTCDACRHTSGGNGGCRHWEHVDDVWGPEDDGRTRVCDWDAVVRTYEEHRQE